MHHRRFVRWVVCVALACAAVLSFAGMAQAQPSPLKPIRPDWAFKSPVGEGAVFTLSAASNATMFIPQRKGKWDARRQVAPRKGPDIASDITGAIGGAAIQAATGYIFESSYLWVQRARHPGVEAMRGSLVEAESVLLTNGIVSLIKRLTGRCRPRGYHNKVCEEFDAFPSGHTSPIAALAGARMVRLLETSFHDPSAGLRVASFAGAELGMTATAFLRVAAGAHSLEDVVVGALVGQSTGTIIALMHPPTLAPIDAGRITPSAPASTPSFQISWGGQF